MGVLGGFLGGIGSFLGGLPQWGKLLITIGVTVGLDLISGLLNRPSGQTGPRLKDLQYSESSYGNSIMRCRGTVRLSGNVIWGSPILETVHKSDNNTTYSYRVNLAVAFARGPAQKILTIWVDGKRLYSSRVSNATMNGSVTVAAAARGGDLNVTLQAGSGASLSLAVGTIIQFPDEPNVDYQVQSAITLGSGQSGAVGVWPAFDQDIAAGGQIVIPGLQGPTWDNTWFQGVDSENHPVTGSASFYLGTSTQLPDPTMVAAMGVPNTPAYRDLVYIVLSNLQLMNSGNRIPMLSAEVAFDSSDAAFPYAGPILNQDGTALDVPEEFLWNIGFASAGSDIPGGLGLSLPYMFIFNKIGLTTGSGLLYRIDVNTNRVVGSISLPNSQVCPVVDWEGQVFVHWAPALNSFRIDKFNALTGEWLGGVPNYPDDNPVPAFQEMKLVDKLDGSRCLACIRTGALGDIYVYDRDYVPAASWFDIIGLAVSEATGGAWDIVTELASLGHRKHTTIALAGVIGTSTPPVVGPPPTCTSDKYGDIWFGQGTGLYCPGRAKAFPSVTTNIITQLFYSPTDDSMVCFGQNELTRVDCQTGVVLGSFTTFAGGSSVPFTSTAIDALGTIVLAGKSAWGATGTWFRVQASSILTGSTPQTTDYLDSDFVTTSGRWQASIYDQVTSSMWFARNGSVYRLYLDRSAAGDVPLADILAWLCSDAGLLSSEYDVSLVTGGVGGVQFEQQAIRDSLNTVMMLGPMDARETDGKLVFVPRGGATILTIPESDLGARDLASGSPERRLSEVLQQEIDTPYRVTLKYYDVGRQHQQGAQDARRISQPYASDLIGARKVMNSRNEFALTLPVAWSASAAKQQAEKLLYDFWISRFTYSWKNSLKYLRLDPTDVVALSYKGELLEARLTQTDRGAGLALEFSATSCDSDIYSSVAASIPGGLPIPWPLPPPSPAPLPSPLGFTEHALAPTAPANFTISQSLGSGFVALIQMTSAGVIWFRPPRYDGTSVYLVASDSGLTGFAELLPTPATVEIDLIASDAGDLSVPHGLGAVPALVLLQQLSGGALWAQSPFFDVTSINVSAVGPATWKALVYLTAPIFGGAGYSTLPLAPGTDQPIAIPHGLGKVPVLVLIRPTSASAIWFQPARYDATNIYVQASDSSATGVAEIWA